jgi:hypothetical protein
MYGYQGQENKGVAPGYFAESAVHPFAVWKRRESKLTFSGLAGPIKEKFKNFLLTDTQGLLGKRSRYLISFFSPRVTAISMEELGPMKLPLDVLAARKRMELADAALHTHIRSSAELDEVRRLRLLDELQLATDDYVAKITAAVTSRIEKPPQPIESLEEEG